MSHTPRANLLPGIEVDFGGGTLLTVPPLNLGALRRLQGKLQALQTLDATSPQATDTIVEATHAALKRNYPDITIDEVEDLLDVGNMHDVFTSVMDVAGLRRKAIAEAEAAKNQTPQAQQTAPTPGAPSLPTSASTPDGHGTTSATTLTSPSSTPLTSNGGSAPPLQSLLLPTLDTSLPSLDQTQPSAQPTQT